MKAKLLIVLLLTVAISCRASGHRCAGDSLKHKVDTVAAKAVGDTGKTIIDTLTERKQAVKKSNARDSKDSSKENDPAKHDNSATVVKHPQTNVYRVKFRGNLYDYMVVDLSKSDLRLCWKNGKGQKYNSIQAVLADTTLIANDSVELITNGGMYTGSTDPQGLYIQEGRKYRSLDTLKSGNGDNFHLKPNGVFYLDSAGAHIDITEFYAAHVKHTVKYATQSGPMLVVNGVIHPAFHESSQNLNIRSGVGVINPNSIVLAISEGTTNFYDFAALFKYYLNCSNALYLDGAISKMYIPRLRTEDTGGHFGPIILVAKRKTKP